MPPWRTDVAGSAAAPRDAALEMLPLTLHVGTLPIFVIGNEGAVARLAALDERGAANVHVFSEAPDTRLAEAAGARLRRRRPSAADFAEVHPRLVFVADVPEAEAAQLHRLGHDHGALVHVQDTLSLCDFHMPAILRRGMLQLAVSTGGAAPGLARLMRDHLAGLLGPEWEDRTAQAAVARRAGKDQGLSFQELTQALADMIAARGWFRGPKS